MSGASTRLYVGRLAPDTTRDDVADLFNRVGPIVDVRVLNGFGFIEFEDVRDAEYAVRDFDGTMFMGAALSCNSPSSRRVVSAILSVDRAMDTRREAGAMDRRVHRRVVDRVAASTA